MVNGRGRSEASTLRPARRLRRTLRGAAALFVLLALVAAVLVGRAWLHAGEAMPGVHVLGTDLAGTPEAELGPAIRSLVARRLAEPVPLQVSGRTVEIPAAKLFLLDRAATVDAAMDAGRSSWRGRADSLLAPATDGVEIAPRLVVRPNADERLVALLKPFARPPVDATVRMAG